MCCTSLIGCSNYRATECRRHSVAALSGPIVLPAVESISNFHLCILVIEKAGDICFVKSELKMVS